MTDTNTKVTVAHRADPDFPGMGVDCNKCGMIAYSFSAPFTGFTAVDMGRMHMARHAVVERKIEEHPSWLETEAGHYLARFVPGAFPGYEPHFATTGPLVLTGRAS